MTKSDFEIKSLVYFVLIACTFNLVFSICGFCCVESSLKQILLYQIGNAFAISGAVMAGRYIGLRNEQVAASGFILLGIAHGISLGALSRSAINIDRGMTIVMPMIPALAFMFWCGIFPKWLRLCGLIPISLFTMVYVRVQLGYDYFDWPQTLGYGTLQLIELFWGVYIYKDWKQHKV
ncbi:MAG TPA: hypothetical protein PLS10_05260 [Chitinophagales bacterium]|nr:hypothetical protein [Chitinophagales bacterium]